MLLEISILGIVKTILIVFQVLICLLLILVVMMQRPKQEGLGAAFGGDTMDSLAGAHTTDFMQKSTAILGTLLFVITFAVSILVVAANPNTGSLKQEGEVAANTEEQVKAEETLEVDAAKPAEEQVKAEETLEVDATKPAEELADPEVAAVEEKPKEGNDTPTSEQ